MPEKSHTINLTAPGNDYKCPGCGQPIPDAVDRRVDKRKPFRFTLCNNCGAIGNCAGRTQLSKSDITELRALALTNPLFRESQEKVVAKFWG